MSTNTPNLINLEVAEEGFYATFDKDVVDLPANNQIYLQLPDNSDSEHDVDYNSETHQACIEIIGDSYSDEELSIMNIAKSSYLQACEIRYCKAKTLFFDNDMEESREEVYRFNVLFDGTDSYYPVKESSTHRYYTNLLAWEIDDIADGYFNDDEILDAFNASSSVVYRYDN